MSNRHPLFDTWDELLAGQVPNFLRLYVNPFVAQACLCLGRYVRDTWHTEESPTAMRPRLKWWPTTVAALT